MTVLDQAWPVATSPVTGPDIANCRSDGEWFLRSDIDEIVDAISKPLVDPPPLCDPALEEP